VIVLIFTLDTKCWSTYANQTTFYIVTVPFAGAILVGIISVFIVFNLLFNRHTYKSIGNNTKSNKHKTVNLQKGSHSPPLLIICSIVVGGGVYDDDDGGCHGNIITNIVFDDRFI